MASPHSLAEFCQPGADGLGSRLILKRTEESLRDTGDIVWELTVINGPIAQRSFRVLTGRAFAQDVDRNANGGQAALPAGHYHLGDSKLLPDWVKTQHPELGDGYYIGVTPASMLPRGYQRTKLAIHVDPSFGIPNQESGTQGCIGLDSTKNMADLVALIKQYNIKDLYVCN